jgi:hypothetical protein
MREMLAPLTGWLCFSVLCAMALASLLTGQWAAALLLGYGGGALGAWASWLQLPEAEEE